MKKSNTIPSKEIYRQETAKQTANCKTKSNRKEMERGNYSAKEKECELFTEVILCTTNPKYFPLKNIFFSFKGKEFHQLKALTNSLALVD